MRRTTVTVALTLACTGVFAQQEYIKASNPDTGDRFGTSVSLSGLTLAVGAPRERSDATGVDGDQSNDQVQSAGAAYVFSSDGFTWVQEAYVKASNTGMTDEFGTAVAVDGDTLVVGAPLEDSASAGIDGDPFNDAADSAGAVFVFVRSGGTWSQQAYLKASNPDGGFFVGGDEFGRAVALAGDTLVVGAAREDGGDAVINGDDSDNSAPNAGAAYIFVRNGSTWSQQAYLKSSEARAFDHFGRSVAISGDSVIVGATGHDNLVEGLGTVPDSGAAYVFVRDGSTWQEQAALRPAVLGSEDDFGWSVGLSGDLAIVGAPQEDGASEGVGGDPLDDSSLNAGAAYVFERTGDAWSQQAYLKASNTGPGDAFGSAVAASPGRVLVGAWDEDSSASTINGDGHDDLAARSGAAYLFVADGGGWSQQQFLKAPNALAQDRFGWSVALSGSLAAVGAEREEGLGAGPGAPDTTTGQAAGAAYTIPLEVGSWSDEGCALAGAGGDPLLVASGTLQAFSSNLFELTNAAPSAVGGLFAALSSASIPFKGGTLKPFPFFEPLLFSTTAAGELTLPWVMPPDAPSGLEVWAQWALQDAGAVHGVALSNAVRGLTP
jgi:hypothetical protein